MAPPKLYTKEEMRLRRNEQCRKNYQENKADGFCVVWGCYKEVNRFSRCIKHRKINLRTYKRKRKGLDKTAKT